MINYTDIYLEKKQSTEYEHYQTFKMESFGKGKGKEKGGSVIEIWSFDKGTS